MNGWTSSIPQEMEDFMTTLNLKNLTKAEKLKY
jgi:hypothetical protein